MALGTNMKNNKSLGQHWLKNRAILDEIANLAVVEGVSLCLEIGPGLGTLTSSLLRRFSQVIAIEYDKNLAKNLPASFPGKNLQVIQDDILRIDLAELVQKQAYVVAGNIPYYITSPIIKKLLLTSPSAQKIVLLVQKEVAERVTASAGSHSALSVFVQSYATTTLGPIVKASEFTPPPKVDSAVIILSPRPVPVLSSQVIDFARRGFASPRKKLIHNLAYIGLPREQLTAIFQHLNFNPNARAEDLELEDWNLLYSAINNLNPHKIS